MTTSSCEVVAAAAASETGDEASTAAAVAASGGEGAGVVHQLEDEESLKMFVGQIPRDWSEIECRQLFDDFNCKINSINVLRDKKTGISRGE